MKGTYTPRRRASKRFQELWPNWWPRRRRENRSAVDWRKPKRFTRSPRLPWGLKAALRLRQEFFANLARLWGAVTLESRFWMAPRRCIWLKMAARATYWA